jgi:hypothetical protein
MAAHSPVGHRKEVGWTTQGLLHVCVASVRSSENMVPDQIAMLQECVFVA